MTELTLGLSVVFSLDNLLLCLIGCLVGTLVGVLPGLGPAAALSILLPITAYLSPVGAVIMLAGIYYGAQYGGSTTAILVNVPGESSALVACLDGHQMAKRGRAGAALAVAALVSFFAGTICTLVIFAGSAPIARMALLLGATEYFGLMVLGMAGTVAFARGSLVRAVGMALIGFGLAMVGTDTNSGVVRFGFGTLDLVDGIGFVPIVLGMLGITEIIMNLEKRLSSNAKAITIIGRLWPTGEELRRSLPAASRGTLVGAFFGILPGTGATISTFASYTLEKEISKNREQFGTGVVEGLAGPEAANNAAAQTSFIPMLTLGIPSGTIMALMIGALMMHGIQPGPRMLTTQPELFWGVIVSMWIGNLMLLVINLPLVGVWVRFLSIPYGLLFPCIVLICAIGGYGLNFSTFDIAMLGLFAIFGYLIKKIGGEVAPLAIGFVLGPMLEENFRRAMIYSRGDPMVFITNTTSLVLLLLSVLLVAAVAVPKWRRTKDAALRESEE